MRRCALFGLVLVLAWFPIRFSAAQNGTPARIEVGGISTNSFPQLTLLVNVWDQYDIPVPGLETKSFAVTANGVPVPVLSVENITKDNLPISVVLAIDTSESMAGEPLENAKAAALSFLDNLAPGDEVALLDFNSTVRLASNFTTDFGALREIISGLPANGVTALYDATYQAAELAGHARNPRRFVVFLTDGNEYGQQSQKLLRQGLSWLPGTIFHSTSLGLASGWIRAT